MHWSRHLHVPTMSDKSLRFMTSRTCSSKSELNKKFTNVISVFHRAAGSLIINAGGGVSLMRAVSSAKFDKWDLFLCRFATCHLHYFALSSIEMSLRVTIPRLESPPFTSHYENIATLPPCSLPQDPIWCVHNNTHHFPQRLRAV